MDRMEILRKVAAGEITVDEAEKLLQETASQAKAEAQPEASAEEKAKRTESGSETRSDIRWLHVRVHDLDTDQDQVKVNVPIGLFWPGFWLGSRCGWGWGHRWMRHWWWWDDVEEALERGKTGPLVDVEDKEHRKHVYVYVD